ncbi:MAG: hypothetical protein MRJ96_02475 [Nitrospirales bacterium]|nr:hypothetical protein [Nitrospira sp.]MDR4500307.1 hypothetical protein [Nitrospirales bacterium]
MRRYRHPGILLLLLSVVSLVSHGCSTFIQPLSSGKAEVGYESQVFQQLVSLPPPTEPIVVVVYKFRDQSGQYKSSDTVLQYSTAVTQGATSLLIKALMDAGNGKWFTVLEREGLSNLLNERKIIRQTRKQYTNGDQQLPPLPPLLYAPILLDGGIVAYESNLLSGGMGARYFGAGGFTEFRRDTVTVDLRAVSVKRGTILNTLQTRKTILSAKLEGGLFRFVDPLRLLEIEVGLASNEAPQMAVREAIELAVYGLILEGVKDNTWAFKDPKAGTHILASYFEEKREKLQPPKKLAQAADTPESDSLFGGNTEDKDW